MPFVEEWSATTPAAAGTKMAPGAANVASRTNARDPPHRATWTGTPGPSEGENILTTAVIGKYKAKCVLDEL